MTERLNNTIETQINDGNTIVSQIVDNNQPLQTVIQDVPQVQTVLQNGINVSSQINAPFVEVTSVNGKTGDVITEPVVGEFEPNHYYLKNTMIAYNNNVYYAKEAFTSGSSFNANDWYSVEGSQVTVDSALSTTSENPVQNKVITNALNGKNKTIYTAYNIAPAEDTPEAWKTTLGNNGVYITWYNTTRTFTNQPVQYGFMRTIIGVNDIRQDFWAQTSGVHYARTGNYQGWSSYAGTTGVFKNLGAQPGNGTLTIQRNGTNVQTFTANQTGNATANISVPTKTSEIENDSDFLATEDLFTTKSGTNINFTENESTSLSSFSISGNTVQNGTPTPDAPVAVQTVTGENVVKICGKNLFETPASATNNGIAFTLNSDSTYNISGTAAAQANDVTFVDSNIFVNGATYTLSANQPLPNGARILVEAYNGSTWLRHALGDNAFLDATKQSITAAINTTGSNRIRLTLRIDNGATVNISGLGIQLEKGSTATAYEPYQGQSYEVNLGSIELCKIGTYQDYIYKSGDKWYVHKEIGKEVLDGSGTWTAGGQNNAYIWRAPASDLVMPSAASVLADIICSHLSVVTFSDIYYARKFGIAVPGNGQRICVSTMTDAATTKAWLNTNKPVVYYALATPTDTEITNEALVGQLEAILSQGSTYAGTNNITTVIAAGNVQGELEITYPKFFSKIATTSSLGSIRVGEGLNITPEGTLSTQLGFTTESTSENTKIIELQDGTTTSYPITTKEAILGLKTYDASWLYDLIYDSTAFTSEQVSELREAILNKDDILIYDGDPTSPTGQTSYYRPVLASTSNTLEFLGLLNISFITAGPNMYSYSFMTTDQGETWSLNANSGGVFLATKYKPGSSFYYTTPSSGCSIMLPGILTTSGTAGKFSINLGAPIIASNVTINTFKGNIRTSTGGYWINTGYVDGGQDYLNTSGVTVTAGIDGNQVNFLLTRSSAQSGTTNNTPMTMELNALSLTFS